MPNETPSPGEKPKHEFLPEPFPLTPEQRAAILAKAKADFTAEDLQRFTEIDEGIPMEQVIEELEALEDEPSKKGQ